MATATAPPVTSLNPNSPVPLDTIPISPEGGSGDNSQSDASTAKTDSLITVFHDKDNFTVKHPLANTWTLWFTKPPSGKGDNWAELLKEVISFNSVEEFWGIYNNITATSALPVKADYHLFKKGIRPEWEDPQNKHGGRWAYTSKQRQGTPVDDFWLNACLAAIGETLEDDDDGEVMGVVVNVRKSFYRIGVWTRTVGKSIPGGGDGNNAGGKGRSAAMGQEALMRIGRRFKESLQLKDDEQVEFTGHMDSSHAGSTRAKPKLIV